MSAFSPRCANQIQHEESAGNLSGAATPNERLSERPFYWRPDPKAIHATERAPQPIRNDGQRRGPSSHTHLLGRLLAALGGRRRVRISVRVRRVLVCTQTTTQAITVSFGDRQSTQARTGKE